MKRAKIPADKVLKTLRVRVKDNKSKVLRQKAFEVNQAWPHTISSIGSGTCNCQNISVSLCVVDPQ